MGKAKACCGHALFGWVEDDKVKSMEKEQRREQVLQQLARIFGEEAREKVLFYSEHVGASRTFLKKFSDL